MTNKRGYRYLKVEGTREALHILFVNTNILAADVIQGIGSEFMRAADLAASIEMPLVVNFQGVETISSALIGKLVLLNKKARSHGITLRFTNMSPAVKDVFHRTTGGEGFSGSGSDSGRPAPIN